MTGEIIRVVLPVALKDIFDALAPAFAARTGHRFETAVMLNPEVPGYVAAGASWALAASNPRYIRDIVATGICAGGMRDLGSSPLALTVIGDGDEPPERSKDEIATILRRADSIAVTAGGTSGAQFDRLTEALNPRDAVGPKVRRLPGGGPMAALLAGEVTVAALPLSNVAPVPGVRAAAICPPVMGVHVDLALCLHASAGPGAHAFADWLTDPDRDAELERLGLWRRDASA